VVGYEQAERKEGGDWVRIELIGDKPRKEQKKGGEKVDQSCYQYLCRERR
jgi:hypothetical protein